MSMPKVTKFINAPPRKRLVEVNLVNAGSPEGGLRYCATLQATSEGKRSGLRDRLWALGASQTQLTRLSKRPWIDCRQPRLTISRYKGRDSIARRSAPGRSDDDPASPERAQYADLGWLLRPFRACPVAAIGLGALPQAIESRLFGAFTDFSDLP